MSTSVGTATVVALRNIIKNMVEGNDVNLGPDILNQGKLTKLMSNFVIRPRVIISNNLKYMEDDTLKNIIKTELTVFTAYVSQAFKILINIYGVDASTAIYNLAGTSAKVAFENKDYLEDLFKADSLDKLMLGNEAQADVKNEKDLDKLIDKNFGLFEISIKFTNKNGEEKSLVIPLFIKPVIVFTDTKELIDGLVDDTSETSFFARLDEYRSGAISLKDLIFATDLVKKYKNKRIKNDNDVAKLIKDINNANVVKSIVGGNMKFDTNYNIYIFDIREKPILDEAAEGDIYKTKYRRVLTNNLHAFSISLVDTDKERLVTLLDDDMPPSVLKFSMLKNSKDTDVNEIFKNLLLNKPPF